MGDPISIVADVILNKLLSIAANEVAVAWGYEEKLKSLHDTLEMIRAMLRDADRQKGTKNGVMVWLKQLKDVVSEADDVLDEIDYEMLRREVKTRDRKTRKVSLCLPRLKKFSFRREFGHKIDNINDKLSKINQRANELGLQHEQPGRVHPDIDEYRQTDSYLDEFKVIGRKQDEDHIIRLLTQPSNVEKFTIIPIVGMGGIGKTTLAKSVYNHPQIQQRFDVKAWICVSVEVTLITLLTMILESLTKKKCGLPANKENLITELRKELGGKKYLLVLDDVWDEKKQHWEDFRECMQKVNSSDGSGILVTTRNHEIGNNTKTEDLCSLHHLSDDECWSIFKDRVHVPGHPWLPEFEEIGREIVKKCNGLPLLVKVIGGTLRRYNNDNQKWSSIKNSMIQNQSVEERDRVLETLKLSFDNLPNANVKQCFAFCSIFEEDGRMERGELVRLWMALGLVHADDTRNKEMEDVGNDIFEILVSNCLFQDVERDEYDVEVSCKMHDLVYDLLLQLSGEEASRLVVSPNNDVTIPVSVKHLFLDHGEEAHCTSSSFKNVMKATTLQMLWLRGEVQKNIPFERCEVQKNIPFERCKCLRILNLSLCNLQKLTESIGDLLHLRYLDLKGTEIEVLPKSIGKLYHLQTLNVLRCWDLKKFPEDMKKLTSLRHFEFDVEHIIPFVGEMTSLRTLSAFHVGQERERKIEVLGRMKHLCGEIRIRNLEEVCSKEEAMEADLFGKKKLYKIELEWSGNEGDQNRNDKDVLEGLQPPTEVKVLKIKNYSGDNFPTWVSKMAVSRETTLTPLQDLVEIELRDCSRCSELPMLGGLRSLRKLVLKGMDKLAFLSHGDNAVTTGSSKPLSPSLRSLELRNMKGLEKWIDGAPNSSTMLSPVLETLYIYYCPKITLIDESHHHPLISLKISGCENLESIQSMQGLTSLETLEITLCNGLLEIPDLHSQSDSLKHLEIKYCKKLTSFAGKFDCLSSVIEMELGPFSKELCSFPSLQGIKKLENNLHTLWLFGGGYYESLPEDIRHLTALSTLKILFFKMKELPMWLTNMSSIRYLQFYACEGLDEEAVLRGAPKEAEHVECNYKRLIDERI